MKLILQLAAKDIRRRVRSPLGILVLLAFPLLFAGMLALVFGGGDDASPKVRLLLEDRDGGVVSRALGSAFTSQQLGELFEVRTVKSGEGESMMEQGEASALLILPEGMTRDVLAGTPVRLRLVRNPAEGILPEIAEQVIAVLVDVLDGGARTLRGPLDQLRPYLEDAEAAPSDEAISVISIAFKRVAEGAGEFVFPPAITLEGAFAETESEGPTRTRTLFVFILPGVAVYALFLVGDAAMRDILTEAQEGTLRRQLAGPVRPATLLIAKVVYTLLLSSVSLAILSLVGVFFVPGKINAAAFAAVSFSVVVAVAGASAAVYGFARSERLGSTVASVVYLVFAFAGGSFVPLQSLPGAVRAVAPLSPFYWGTTAYQSLLVRDAGLIEVLPNVAVLSGIGAVMLIVGAIALHRSLRRGSLS
jgi:ABC-2 type transport system permease protein